MIAWLALVAVMSGAPKGGNTCEDRCVGAAKACAQHCEKSFPKADQAPCKQACDGSVAGCKDHCKTEGEAK